MKPISFEESNCVYAKNQPEYLNLPACQTPDGYVVSCWVLSWRERLRLLFVGRLWCMVKNFNQPLQPMKLQIDKPFSESKDKEAAGQDAPLK
jgi:hypothetical protein